MIDMKEISTKFLVGVLVLVILFTNVINLFAFESNVDEYEHFEYFEEYIYFSEIQDFGAASFGEPQEVSLARAFSNDDSEVLLDVEQFDPYYLLYKYGDGSIPRARTNRTLFFNGNGGNVSPNSAVVPAGSLMSWRLPTPTRANHNFLGWFTAPTGGIHVMSDTIMPNANVTLWARWQAFGANSVNVTLEPNPGALDWVLRTRRVNLNTAVGQLPAPAWANHVFLGWFNTPSASGGTQFTQSTIVRGQTNLYGRWRGTITLNANGGTVSPGSINATIGGAVGNLPTPTRAGHTFLGWFNTPAASGGYQIRPNSTLDGGGTIWARWRANQVTVSFDANGGFVNPSSRTFTPGTSIGALPVPTRTGHTFVGWFTTPRATGSAQITSNIIFNDNMTLWARWQVNHVTVTFNANGGTLNTPNRIIPAGTTLGSLPTPSRAGHTFVGWFTTPNPVGVLSMDMDNIYYNGEYGIAIDSHNSLLQILVNTIINNNMTIYAVWRPNPITLTFNPNGGTITPASLGSRTAQPGLQIGFLPNPEREGYRFLGWYSTSGQIGGSRITTDMIVPNINVTFWARWEQLSQWTWPVPASMRVTQLFHSGHLGIDVGGSTPGVDGDPIVAFATGRVVLNWEVSGYGEAVYMNTANINGFDWIQHRYGHLVYNSNNHLQTGQVVTVGTQIGLMGNTGVSFGTHLHFETRRNVTNTEPSLANGGSIPIDPIYYFFGDFNLVLPHYLNIWETSPMRNIEIFLETYTGYIFTISSLMYNFTREEILYLGLTKESLEIAIDYFGIEIILEHLMDKGLEHIGFYMYDGKLYSYKGGMR